MARNHSKYEAAHRARRAAARGVTRSVRPREQATVTMPTDAELEALTAPRSSTKPAVHPPAGAPKK